jgi:hypothetical protein
VIRTYSGFPMKDPDVFAEISVWLLENAGMVVMSHDRIANTTTFSGDFDHVVAECDKLMEEYGFVVIE